MTKFGEENIDDYLKKYKDTAVKLKKIFTEDNVLRFHYMKCQKLANL